MAWLICFVWEMRKQQIRLNDSHRIETRIYVKKRVPGAPSFLSEKESFRIQV